MLYWHWLILGGLFLIFEITSVTTFFLFFSISAFIMALITGLMPNMHLNVQLLIAGVLAFVSCVLWYRVYRIKNRQRKLTDVNNRMDKYIGQQKTLLEDVHNGFSKIKLGDTTWRVEVSSGNKDDTIEITGHKSATFLAKLI
jgi:membrane protein implicated in regulation of membrane protease activity